MPRLVLMSDTHLIHRTGSLLTPIPNVPDGDILVHAGDATFIGDMREIQMFNTWFSAFPHKHKVFVAGNHDWDFQKRPQTARRQLHSDITYLEDSACEIMGLGFYGAPWQPEFQDWAFNLPRGGSHLCDKWSRIPTGVDVLVTHGPPYGILDLTPHGEHVGCELLAKVVTGRVEPRLHVFGHVHGPGGTQRKIGKTLFVNAAILDEGYRYANDPVVVDLE